MNEDLRDIAIKALLEQNGLLTGHLTLREFAGLPIYRLGLHQGTLQTLHVDHVLVWKRSEVVKILADLLKITSGYSSFMPCEKSEFGEEATPMNLKRLLESAASINVEQLPKPDITHPVHFSVPLGSVPFVNVEGGYAPELSNELQQQWQAVALQLCNEAAGLNAEQLAQRLDTTVGKMRLRLFKFQQAGLIAALEQTDLSTEMSPEISTYADG